MVRGRRDVWDDGVRQGYDHRLLGARPGRRRGGSRQAPEGLVNTYETAADADADRAQQLRLLDATGVEF
jgi:hypothetical protein